MFAVLISGTQMIKSTTQVKCTDEKKNKREKIIEMDFIVILRAIQHKKGKRKRMMEPKTFWPS